MDKLLPCPFCGGEATISDGGYSGEKFLARCRELSCPAASGFIRKTHDEAISAWNRRTDHIRDTTKKVSNADRIRGMSDEELARWLVDATVCERVCGEDEYCHGNECVNRVTDWLQQPAKE